MLLFVKDTTAHTMAFALLELTKPENKRVLDKLLQEIDSVIPPSDDHGRFVLLHLFICFYILFYVVLCCFILLFFFLVNFY